MDNNLAKKLGLLLSKVPKKDLNKNIEKAKKILENSNKEDLEKLISSNEVSNILGENKENLASTLNTLPNEIDVEKIKKTLENLN